MGHLSSINPALLLGAIIVLGIALRWMLSGPTRPAVSILWQPGERTNDGMPSSGRDNPAPPSGGRAATGPQTHSAR